MDAYVKAVKGLDLELSLGPATASPPVPWALIGWHEPLLSGTSGEISEGIDPWTLKISGSPPSHQRVPPNAIKDIILVCHYSVRIQDPID